MNQKTLITILVIIVIVLVGALAFMFGQQSTDNGETPPPSEEAETGGENMEEDEEAAEEESGEDGDEEDDPLIIIPPPDVIDLIGQEGDSCNEHSECASDLYCAKSDIYACSLETEGVCQIKPEICPAIYAPVCGCDDATYPSSCSAAAAGVNVSKSGTCNLI